MFRLVGSLVLAGVIVGAYLLEHPATGNAGPAAAAAPHTDVRP